MSRLRKAGKILGRAGAGDLAARTTFAGAPDYFSIDLEKVFARHAPVEIEIGAGKGEFILDRARNFPDRNFLAIELSGVIARVLAVRCGAAAVGNVRVIRMDARSLVHLMLPEASIAAYHIYFPDPWPKERHEKNRLISRWFLEDCVTFLRPGAKLQVKSDYEPNCSRIAELLDHGPEGEELPVLPLRITGVANHVNNTGAPWPDDICTNYQRKMKERGVPVHAVEVIREPDTERGR